MKQYKVIALSCGGLNKVFSSGDLVTEEDLVDDPEQLVKEGFLKEVGEVESKKKGSLLEQLKK